VDHIYQDPHAANPKFHLHYGDLTDTSNLTRILQEVQPDEVYNLGAMSHVAVSFESPEYTADVDAMGTLRLLEAIRFLVLRRKPVSTRHPPLSCTAWCRKSHRKRPRRSTHVLRMR
jgi:GDPmannose 4,6-dehydratase